MVENTEAREVISRLFNNAPPVLVEVRFPNMGTSPDWYLCGEEEQFDQLFASLGPGVEVHLHSVWDLRNVKEAVRVTKPEVAR
jgi:hypothetical protein